MFLSTSNVTLHSYLHMLPAAEGKHPLPMYLDLLQLLFYQLIATLPCPSNAVTMSRVEMSSSRQLGNFQALTGVIAHVWTYQIV